MVEPTGKNVREIGRGGFPTWSADGKVVYFCDAMDKKIRSVDTSSADLKVSTSSTCRGRIARVSLPMDNTSHMRPKASCANEIAAMANRHRFSTRYETIPRSRPWPVYYARLVARRKECFVDVRDGETQEIWMIETKDLEVLPFNSVP